MQIKKINNNKLKVILNSNDLLEKKINIDSFLANSIESQDLFFEILDLAEEKYDFNIEDNKAVVEAISLDNNIFILTITKLKNSISNTYNEDYNIFCFEDVNTILYLFSLANKNKIQLNNISIYKLFNKYYLFFSNNLDTNFKNILIEYSKPISNLADIKEILIEYGNIIFKREH